MPSGPSAPGLGADLDKQLLQSSGGDSGLDDAARSILRRGNTIVRSFSLNSVSRPTRAATAFAEPAPSPPWMGRRFSMWMATSAGVPEIFERQRRPSSMQCCGYRWERGGRWR